MGRKTKPQIHLEKEEKEIRKERKKERKKEKEKKRKRWVGGGSNTLCDK